MAFVADSALDALLDRIGDSATALHVCSGLPATYAQATGALSLGSAANVSLSVAADRPGGGRRRRVNAISGGNITVTGIATHWALVKATAPTELLAAGPLTPSQTVTNGNIFDLAAFDIGVPDAA